MEQKHGSEAKWSKKHTTPGIRWSSPTQLLIGLSKAYVLGYEGSKNRGCRDPKTSASLPLLVSSVLRKREAGRAAGPFRQVRSQLPIEP